MLLKLSGEAFCAPGGFGIEPGELAAMAHEIKDAFEVRGGVDLAVVVGGGNFVRGAKFAKIAHIHQATADHMGMLATVINGLALKEALLHLGVESRVMTAIDVRSVAEPFIRGRALRHFDKGRVVILVAGTGNPFCTTDTCAALRAIELECDVLMKATKVDGVYTADPKLHPEATHFAQLSHHDVLSRDLKVMDAAAISLARENKIPIIVFSIHKPGNFAKVMLGEGMHTVIGDRPQPPKKVAAARAMPAKADKKTKPVRTRK